MTASAVSALFDAWNIHSMAHAATMVATIATGCGAIPSHNAIPTPAAAT